MTMMNMIKMRSVMAIMMQRMRAHGKDRESKREWKGCVRKGRVRGRFNSGQMRRREEGEREGR